MNKLGQPKKEHIHFCKVIQPPDCLTGADVFVMCCEYSKIDNLFGMQCWVLYSHTTIYIVNMRSGHMRFVTFNKLINYRQVFLGEEISKAKPNIQKRKRQQQQQKLIMFFIGFYRGQKFSIKSKSLTCSCRSKPLEVKLITKIVGRETASSWWHKKSFLLCVCS